MYSQFCRQFINPKEASTLGYSFRFNSDEKK